jgi:hypothetical protein
MRTSTRCSQKNWRRTLEYNIKFFLTLLVFSFFTSSVFGQAASSPCTAHRWNSGEAWSKNATTGLWTGVPASGQTQPQGVVGCASAAATESGLEQYKGHYNPADFAITGLGDCFSMDNNTFGNALAGPETGEDIVWFNFDIRPLAGTYQFQIVSNQPIGWALYYVDPSDARPNASDLGPTYPPTGLSGNCANLKPANIVLSGGTHGNCGLQGQGWSTITVPSFNKPTNYYLAMWLAPTGTGDGKSTFPGSINLVYKSRFGCGGATCTIEALDKTFSCVDNTHYQVCGNFAGSAGRWVIQDNAAIKATSYTVTTYKQDNATVVSTATYASLDGTQKLTLGTIPDGAVFAKICATYGTGQPYNISLVPDGTFSGGADYVTCGDGASFSGNDGPVKPAVVAAVTPATGITDITPNPNPNPSCPSVYELNLLKQNVVNFTVSGAPAGTVYGWTQAPGPVSGNTSFTFNSSTGAATFTVNSLTPLPASNYTFIVTATSPNGCTGKDTICIAPTSVLPTCNLCGPSTVCSGGADAVYSLKDDCTSNTVNTLDLDDFDYVWTITNVVGTGSVTFVGTSTNVASVTAHINGTVTSYIVRLNINGKGPLHINVPQCTKTTTVGSVTTPTLAKTEPTCSTATGCITVTSSTAGLTFSFDGGAFAAYPANGWCGLAAGSPHTVVAKNTDGCTSPQASATLATQPSNPTAPIVIKVDPTCAMATGCVIVTSSTTGLQFSFDNGTYGTYPVNGWCTLLAGSSHTVRVKNSAGCESNPVTIVIGNLPVCSTYCSYTQGFWGNKNGAKLLPSLLTAPLTVGRAGHSVIIPINSSATNSAVKVNNVMPGGTAPTVLLAGDCDITASCFNAYLAKGKIGNVLLSQTIALSLNLRLPNNPLGSFPIQSECAVTTGGTFQINQNVVNYLTYNGATATVTDLLNLANDLLGAVLAPGQNTGTVANPRIVPSYSDVNNAVDAINNGFDGCRGFFGYQPCITLVTTRRTNEGVSTAIETANAVEVMARPNPFSDVIRFTIKASSSGHGTLEVFNMVGQKIKTVYEGFVQTGEQTIEYRVPVSGRQNLIYVFTLNGKQQTGKLLNLRQ